MNSYAIIKNSRVSEVLSSDQPIEVLLASASVPDWLRQADVIHPLTGEQECHIGWLWQDNSVQPPPTDPIDIPALRQATLARIDAAAEAARMGFVTPGSGQAMVYLAKEAEAERYLADPAPDPARYRLLAAEVGITAPDLPGVAAAVSGLAAGWREAAAAIEAIRLSAKQTVMTLEDPAALGDFPGSIVWPV